MQFIASDAWEGGAVHDTAALHWNSFPQIDKDILIYACFARHLAAAAAETASRFQAVHNLSFLEMFYKREKSCCWKLHIAAAPLPRPAQCVLLENATKAWLITFLNMGSIILYEVNFKGLKLLLFFSEIDLPVSLLDRAHNFAV